jgi:hypothetical protein
MTKSSSSSTTGGCGGVSPHGASLRPNLQYILSLFKEELDYLNKGWAAISSLIQIKSGCFQQRMDLLQRLGFAMRCF